MGVTMMFCGLTSRWISPAACAASRAAATWRDELDGAGRLDRSLLEQVLHGRTTDQPHVDVEVAVDLAPVVDRNHVRLLKYRRSARLALEPRPEALVIRELRGEDLQRDGPTLVGVLCLVHLAHAALAEHADDLVLAEHLTDA